MTTTNTKYTPAPITKIKGQECRYTKIDNRKFLYYSDLTKIVGTDFVKELRTSPIVARVADGSNSQDRRLVNVTDFRNAFRQFNEKLKLTKVKTSKAPVSRCVAVQDCFDFELSDTKKVTTTSECKSAVKAKSAIDLSSVHIDASAIGSIYSNLSAKEEMLKSQINAIVHKYVNALVVENGFSDDSPETCELRAHAYTSLYKEFDKHYAAELGKRDLTLEQVGLGAKVRYGGSRYMDVLASKGALETMFVVAKHFFDKK
jgi:hypothetical protein